MRKINTNIDSKQLSETIVKGIQEKKGFDISIIDLREKTNVMSDFLVICTGNSDSHIDSISLSIEEEVFKSCQEWPYSVEGRAIREWILLDYINVIVHVFRKDRRDFYRIENMWSDAKITEIENI